MKIALRVLVASTFLSGLILMVGVANAAMCDSVEGLLALLDTQYDEQPAVTAQTKQNQGKYQGTVITVNKETHAWTIVMESPMDPAHWCMFMAGENFSVVPPRPKKDPET